MTIFRDNPHGHFNPKWRRADADRKAHERGKELKVLFSMGLRSTERSHAQHVLRAAQLHNKRPVTLPALKWGRDD